MGKGDKKTKKGKLFQGSYGKTRPRKKENTNSKVVATKPVKEAEAPAAKSKEPAKKEKDQKEKKGSKE